MLRKNAVRIQYMVAIFVTRSSVCKGQNQDLNPDPSDMETRALTSYTITVLIINFYL